MNSYANLNKQKNIEIYKSDPFVYSEIKHHMSTFAAESARAVECKTNSINYKLSSVSIEDNPYGNFKNRVNREQRKKACNNPRSRLYKKCQNAEAIKIAREEMEDNNHFLFEESDSMEKTVNSFLELKINIDLSSDTVIAKNAKDYEKLKALYEALLRCSKKVDREQDISFPKKERFNRKLEDFGKLIGYYTAKCELITNPYYMSHYDDELGVYYESGSSDDSEDTKRKEVSSLIMTEQAWKSIIHGENAVLKSALENIENTEAKKACMLGTSLIAYKQKYNQAKYTGELFSKSNPIIVWFLKKINAFKRDSYTVPHGKQNYEKSLDKLKYIPKRLKRLNDNTENHVVFRHDENSPEIDLTKHYKDEYKAGLKRLYIRLYESDISYNNPNEYEKSVQAIGAYLETNGIVNKDTVEMEMAFLDRFLSSSKIWLDSNPDISSDENYLIIKSIREKIINYSQGTLKASMKEEDFEFVKKHAVTVREYIKQHSKESSSNIKDIPLFLHQPNMNDIKQSTIGDCWFLSAVTSIVKTSPDFIRGMFQDLGDGRVMVRLYDARSKNGYRQHKIKPNYNSEREEYEKPDSVYSPVYVILDKQYETGWGNAADCPWLQLLERAYAACGFNRSLTYYEKTGSKKIMHHMIDEMTNGEMDAALSHITGKTVISTPTETIKRPRRVNIIEGFKDYSTEALDFYFNVKDAIESGKVLPCEMGNHCMDIIDTTVYNNRIMLLIRDPFNIYHKKYTKDIYEKPKNYGMGTTILINDRYRELAYDTNLEKNIHRGFLGTSWWDLDDVTEKISAIIY